MSDELRNLVMPLGEFDPPLDLHTRILERERELAVPSRWTWRPPRVLMIAVAAAGVGLAILLLALAAHSRSSAPGPANHGLRATFPTSTAGSVPCAAGDLATTIEVLRPSQRQDTDPGSFKTTLNRPVATIVVQNVSGHSCHARPPFVFKIRDRLGRVVGNWNDGGNWFDADYTPGASQTFSLPAVYHCNRPGPFTAVAHVGGHPVRRRNLNRSQITCG